MNPAESPAPTSEAEQVRMALTNQGAMLGAHQDQLRHLTDLMGLLLDSLHRLENRLPEPSPAPTPAALPGPQQNPHTPSPEPKIAAPQRYDGRSGGCKPFLAQCSQIFRLQPYSFATEAVRVAYIITLLSDRALLWATALVEKKSATVWRCSPITSVKSSTIP